MPKDSKPKNYKMVTHRASKPLSKGHKRSKSNLNATVQRLRAARAEIKQLKEELANMRAAFGGEAPMPADPHDEQEPADAHQEVDEEEKVEIEIPSHPGHPPHPSETTND